MPLRRTLRDLATRTAWDRLLKLWKPIAGWTAIVWAVELVLLAPLSGLVLGRLLIRGDRIVVGNIELASWILSPWGLAYVLAGGGLALMGAVLRYAGIFRILTDYRRGHGVSILRTALYLAVQAPAIFRLCLGVVVLAVLALLPLAAGLGLIHEIFLGSHELYYYSRVAPPEWIRALWVAAAWTAAWASAVLILALRFVLAVPAFIDGRRPFPAALKWSWKNTAEKRVRILHAVGLAVLAWIAIRAAVDAALFGVAGRVVHGLGLPVSGMVYASAAYLVLAVVLDAIIVFIGFSLVSTLLTKFYYEETVPPPPAHPPRAPSGRPVRVGRMLRRWLRPRRSLALLAFLLIAAGAMTVFQLQRASIRIDFTVVAHRGAGFLAPENSLSAIERSIATGVDYAEIDVQRTRDGVLVVFHDADLMRLAGDPRRINETDYADLAEVDVGAGFHPRFAGERIPTLAECLDAARNRVGLMIELKYFGYDPRLAVDCVRLVRDRGMEEQVALMSLYTPGVLQLRELAPDIRVGYLSMLTAGDVARLDVDFVGVPLSRASSAFMRAARRRGLPVYVWGVGRSDRMVAVIERGAAGLITSAPETAMRLRAELLNLTPAELLLLRFRQVWE